MNFLGLKGNITKEIELRDIDGKAAISFSIAVNAFKKGEKTVMFMNCSAFGKTAENIHKFFYKGDPIIVTGALDFYYDKDKNTRYQMNVWQFDFAGKNNQNSDKNIDTENIPF